LDLVVSVTTALAESFNGLYKAECIHHKGPWRNVDNVEWATLIYVDWFNNRKIHESLDYVPPVEFEATYYAFNESEIWPFWKRFSVPKIRPDS
jgi:putative transposase